MFNKKGFTLVELLVVIAIIGILAAIVIVNLATARDKANNAQVVAYARNAATALEMYRDDNNGYPDETTWSAGAALGTYIGAFSFPAGTSGEYTYTSASAYILEVSDDTDVLLTCTELGCQ